MGTKLYVGNLNYNTTEESLGRSLARLANLAETYVSARNPE